MTPDQRLGAAIKWGPPRAPLPPLRPPTDGRNWTKSPKRTPSPSHRGRRAHRCPRCGPHVMAGVDALAGGICKPLARWSTRARAALRGSGRAALCGMTPDQRLRPVIKWGPPRAPLPPLRPPPDGRNGTQAPKRTPSPSHRGRRAHRCPRCGPHLMAGVDALVGRGAATRQALARWSIGLELHCEDPAGRLPISHDPATARSSSVRITLDPADPRPAHDDEDEQPVRAQVGIHEVDQR